LILHTKKCRSVATRYERQLPRFCPTRVDTAMTSRVTEERVPELGKIVRDVAAELTVALGGVMPR
jgi:hypothetical protein